MVQPEASFPPAIIDLKVQQLEQVSVGDPRQEQLAVIKDS
jgi:hypothetical protein